MNRQISLLLVALLLGGAYVYFFTDLFRAKPPIEIHAQIRSVIGSSRRTPKADTLTQQTETLPVTFTFDDDYKLTEIKVVAADDFKTNKYPHALWHMISDNSSTPQKGIIYGSKIKGMKPSIPRGKAEPLQPNTVYVLMIEAGKSKGQVNFKTREAVKRI